MAEAPRPESRSTHGRLVPGGPKLRSIGQALNALRSEFPDISISKIRFLESEGLITPERSPTSGYRRYSEADIERLRYILSVQRDHYLPLKVIREHLAAMERGEAVRLPAVGGRRDVHSAVESTADGPVAARIGREQLLAAAGIDERTLAEWESYGLLTQVEDGVYDAEAVTIAELVGELGRHGIEPRHLRAMKAAADREAGLVEQVVAPLRRHRNPQTRARAEARTKELAGLTVKLHAALVRTALGVRQP